MTWGTRADRLAADAIERGGLHDLSRRAGQSPSRPHKETPRRQVWIVGGNALPSGHEAIQYSASVTMAAVYDPDVDTTYPVGLGNAWLFVDGVRQTNRVLVHHDFIGYTQPLLAGRIMGVRDEEVLTYGTDHMLAYLLTLP